LRTPHHRDAAAWRREGVLGRRGERARPPGTLV